ASGSRPGCDRGAGAVVFPTQAEPPRERARRWRWPWWRARTRAAQARVRWAEAVRVDPRRPSTRGGERERRGSAWFVASIPAPQREAPAEIVARRVHRPPQAPGVVVGPDAEDVPLTELEVGAPGPVDARPGGVALEASGFQVGPPSQHHPVWDDLALDPQARGKGRALAAPVHLSLQEGLDPDGVAHRAVDVQGRRHQDVEPAEISIPLPEPLAGHVRGLLQAPLVDGPLEVEVGVDGGLRCGHVASGALRVGAEALSASLP